MNTSYNSPATELSREEVKELKQVQDSLARLLKHNFDDATERALVEAYANIHSILGSVTKGQEELRG